MPILGENNWEKIPLIGSLIGMKEIFQGGKRIAHLAFKDKTTIVGSKIFRREEAYQQAGMRILRGFVAVVPFLGGIILAIWDRCVKNVACPIPFPAILKHEKIEIANLKDLDLVDDIFNTEKIVDRLDWVLKKRMPEIRKGLKEDIRQIDNRNASDKQKLKLLKMVWIKALSAYDDGLAKLNFTPENIQRLGYRILEDAWIESIRHTIYSNSMIEVTRDCVGVSDISMAACFSVLAKYPQLRSSPLNDDPKGQYRDIKYIQIHRTKEFATSLACQSLANLIAADRKDLQGIFLNNVGIDGDRAEEMAQGFAHNHHIRHIEMVENTNLEDKGAMAICQGLHASFHHPNYDDQPSSLNLGSCGIGDASIEALLTLVKGASNQVYLYLANNQFSEEGKRRFREEVTQLNQRRPENKQINLGRLF